MPSQAETLVQRVRSIGVRGASTVDLAAVGFSRREADAVSGEEMSRTLLTRFQGIRGLLDISNADIAQLTGLEDFEALRCQALMELGRRIGIAGKGPVNTIHTATDVFQLLEYLRHEKREYFMAILMDTQHGVLRVVPVHIGTLTMSIVGPREVFREAIREGASCMIVAHNHPSGDPTPSDDDIAITKKLMEIGKMLDIPVLDHVVIGETHCVSLKEERYV